MHLQRYERRVSYSIRDWTPEEEEAFNELSKSSPEFYEVLDDGTIVPLPNPDQCLEDCHDYGCVRSGVCGRK